MRLICTNLAYSSIISFIGTILILHKLRTLEEMDKMFT